MSRLILGVATATLFMIGTAASTMAQTDGAATGATGATGPDAVTEQSDRQPTSRSDRKRQWRGERMRGHHHDPYSDRRHGYGHHHGWMKKGDRMPMMHDYRGPRMGHGGGMHAGGGGWGMMPPHMLMMMMVLMDTDSSGALSLEEMQAVQERMFNMIDQDGDGELTLQELQGFMRGGMALPDQQDAEASESDESEDGTATE